MGKQLNNSVFDEVKRMNDFGMLNLNSDEVTYTYKNETYQLYSHPYEPCLYLYRRDELVCTLHNAYLRRSFYAFDRMERKPIRTDWSRKEIGASSLE